jgi:lipopolysaccharide biosynthesis glycosyltransferase
MMPVFIGWDEREDVVGRVCESSILRHANGGVILNPLQHRKLRHAGLFWREWRIGDDGQYWDDLDGKPFSTQFSHSRFLTPHLAKQTGAQWAMFVDCDFLFRRDVAELFALADPTKALMCVKHQQPDTGARKMDGMKQIQYPRKNWSSLMLFNLHHEANARLTPECVNAADGSWLHQFGWLSDDQIGALPGTWNHLATIDSNDVDPASVHFTLGGPWFDEWPASKWDDEWVAVRSSLHA